MRKIIHFYKQLAFAVSIRSEFSFFKVLRVVIVNRAYDSIKLITRAQLFKANDVVSWRFVKIYIEWYAKMLKFFAEKMWVAFAVQHWRHFFQQKISEYCILNLLEMTLNELVKPTTLWTTGPSSLAPKEIMCISCNKWKIKIIVSFYIVLIASI